MIMILYLDACSICRPFDDLTVIRNKLEKEAILEILSRIQNEEYIWKRSEVLDVEINEIRNLEKREKIKNTFSHVPTQIFYNSEVKKLLKKVQSMGFELMDSIHICSAITGNCDIFISTDDDLIKIGQKYSQKLKLQFLNPLDFINKVRKKI